jgi:hypothetical protein
VFEPEGEGARLRQEWRTISVLSGLLADSAVGAGPIVPNVWESLS